MKANPAILGDMSNDLALGRGPTSKNDVQPIVATPRARMNRTEEAYSRVLDAMKSRGDILRWEFQGMTLRWECGNKALRYTADFVVFEIEPPNNFKLIEIKGGYRKMPGFLERAVERFRHAKTRWPELTFELHQRTKEGWKQLI